MASILLLLLISFLSLNPSSCSSSPSSHQRRLLQSAGSPTQNIQTFFPSISSPAFINAPPLPPPAPPEPPNSQSPPRQSGSRDHRVTTAVLATAASSFAFSFLLFFVFLKLYPTRRRLRPESLPPAANNNNKSFKAGAFRSKPEGSLKGVIVDENGLDVLYWRQLDDDNNNNRKVGDSNKRCEHCNRVLRRLAAAGDDELREMSSERNDEDSSQDMPLLPANSVNSSARIDPDTRIPLRSSSLSYSEISDDAVARARSSFVPSRPPPPSPPPPPPPKSTPTPPHPPPRPPPLVVNKPAPPAPSPPRPPVGPNKPGLPPPSPPPSGSSSRPPPVPARSGSGKAQPRLKPLHWDKLTPLNPEHSVVWDRISGGSVRFDDDLMEALFGYVATSKKPGSNGNRTASSPSAASGSTTPPSQICLLEPRKSQNIAIVVRTLDVSRQDILDALLEGRELSSDTLEKLSRTAPTKEEAAKILDFAANSSKLADAESFLYHLLRAVPSAFARLDAMLFRSNFKAELQHLEGSLETLEHACREMREQAGKETNSDSSREKKPPGAFVMLLQLILQAGNKLNDGTARGNAQAFDLAVLRKLPAMKTKDGKTSLLDVVVEEAVFLAGERLVTKRSHTGRRRRKDLTDKECREYMMIGLPVVGGLSTELTNVKRAAGIDYDAIVGGNASLGVGIREIRQFLATCEPDGFVEAMRGFLDTADEKLRELRTKQTSVVEQVQWITQYYQQGAKEKGAYPLQLFIIVRDFLLVLDPACVELARNLQKRKQAVGAGEPGSSWGPGRNPPARFQNLPAYFLSDNSKSNSDSDEDGF